MTDQIAFPPLHDPAPGELARRKQHLLSEITRDETRFRLPRLSSASPLFRRGSHPRRAMIAVAATAVAVVGAATAFGTALALGSGSPGNLSGNQSVAPVTYSATYGWTPTIPSSASTPAAIVSAIGNRASLGTALRVSLSNSPAPRQGYLLSFDVATDGSVAGNIHGAWVADLVQGVVAEAFAARGMPPVIGSTVTGDLPNGQTVALQGGMGDVVASQRFLSDSDAAIQQRLEAVLAQANLTPVSITVMHIGQPAPAVIVKTNDPSSAAAAAEATIRALFGANPPLYEGYYFEIENAAGTPLLATSASFRTGAGRQWVDPSVAATSSLIHG